MLSLKTRVIPLCLLIVSAVSAKAQFYKIHNGDLGVNAVGVYGIKTLDSNSGNVLRTTDTTGFLLSFKEHPVSWAGIEVNYGYAKFSNRFSYQSGTTSATLPITATRHEATAAYIFHPHIKHLQPYVGVGGGALGFIPIAGAAGSDQWRGAGLLEAGLDIPTSNPHLGFRVSGRALFYREPNFNVPVAATRAWTVAPEPTAGVYYRF